MDTAHLKAFLRIAETGSISRAAESLGIAQPSLSQQLLRLEDEIGIRLFDRTARGVTLTEGGRVFQERARQLLHAADQAVTDTRQLRDEVRGLVVFAMPPSIARMIGAPLVEALSERSPLVRVRVVEAFSGTIRGWIEAEKIDLGIVYDLGPLRHLVARPLLRDELVAVGPAGRFADADWPDGMPFAQLADEAIIAPGVQHGLRQIIDREATRAGLDLAITQDIDSIDTIVELVARGRGIAILPHCAAVEPLRSRKLSMTRMGSGGLWRRLTLVRNPSQVLTHASVRVEDLTRTIMAELIAAGRWWAHIEAE